MAKKDLTQNLPNCDKELWRRGEHIATVIDLEPETIEDIVKTAAKSSGQRIDWHYFGGRACIRAMGDLNSAREYLQQGLEPYEGKYSFTTDLDSGIPFPL
ncbi:MAG: hypothetical protein ACOCP4_05095 [Candidatus Woesearchaeota archaeon]